MNVMLHKNQTQKSTYSVVEFMYTKNQAKLNHDSRSQDSVHP